jgi:quercetin dioxygenase-like cupin family protein
VEVIRKRPATQAGPAERFTGSVWLDLLGAPPAPSAVQVLAVHFTPGARTAWHTHPVGQLLHVLEGEGRAQHGGGPREEIRAGDSVQIPPGEWHWHGAAPDHFMTHLAVQEGETEWGDPVSDEDYAG